MAATDFFKTLHIGGSENPDTGWPPKGSPTSQDLRDWADHPAASGFVPISPRTLRYLAAELERLEWQRTADSRSEGR